MLINTPGRARAVVWCFPATAHVTHFDLRRRCTSKASGGSVMEQYGKFSARSRTCRPTMPCHNVIRYSNHQALDFELCEVAGVRAGREAWKQQGNVTSADSSGDQVVGVGAVQVFCVARGVRKAAGIAGGCSCTECGGGAATVNSSGGGPNPIPDNPPREIKKANTITEPRPVNCRQRSGV
jgi:hypothetical protein